MKPKQLIKVIKAVDFDFKQVNFSGKLPDSREFSIIVVRAPSRKKADKKLFFC